ncbi:MAG TPA: xanthine dehydrogenase family protein molybdopterin-binding subunit [Candidatus Micrarchaeia archaeon]|nr:xanthine dehydrogenase family protein molybdopterin-binding subunit [Candidatus Micrarchaeia archaeon]
MSAGDAGRRVLGELPYVLDHRVPGQLEAKVVRSPHPHGRLRGADTTAALRASGVVAVVTGDDIVRDRRVTPTFGRHRSDQPVLAIGTVRYAGEPVALVVAETVDAAEAGRALVDVRYDPLPHVIDAEAAGEPGAPQLHTAWSGNACGEWALRHGDIERGWAEAERVFEGTYRSPPASHVPMEPHCCVASWEGEHLSVWTTSQAPHRIRADLESVFQLQPGGVRVQTFDLGGAFGSKGQTLIEPMTAFAARLLGRAVRLELDRDEEFLTIGKHAATVRLATGVTRAGRLVARRIEVVYNAGAYALSSPQAAGQGLLRTPGPYRIPSVEARAIARYTNTVPSGPFRGAMTSQLAFAYESQMDEIAAELGIDPVELRRRNLLRAGDEYATGEHPQDLHFDELLEDAARAIGWGETAPPTSPARARGKGVAVMIKTTLTPSRSVARIELHADGRATIRSSSVEMGQGARDALSRIVAQELGLDETLITMPHPDTDTTPFDTTTSSSRTTASMGTALTGAANDLKRQLGAIAAAELGVAAVSLVHAGGAVSVDRGGATLSYQQLCRGMDAPLVGEGSFESEGGLPSMDPLDVRGFSTVHWHQGAAAAEVEVDRETGRVTVLRCHGNAYAGRVVSPHRVRQQNEGSVIFALGQALMEELVYEDGRVVNPNLAEYMIPSILDMPELTSSAVESADAGAERHGVGEMAVPAVAPAIANAVFHATGARIRRLPLTPERVLRALRGEPEEAGAGAVTSR